jgi:hypothetical protein
LKKIELPSEALAKELQRHLLERKFAIKDRATTTLRFPDEMKSSEWSSVKAAVEKWASGKHLESVESIKLQPLQPAKREKEDKEKEVDKQGELRKKIDGLTPQMAEERYNYLQSKPIGELTDEEYDERLELAQRDFKKWHKK